MIKQCFIKLAEFVKNCFKLSKLFSQRRNNVYNTFIFVLGEVAINENTISTGGSGARISAIVIAAGAITDPIHNYHSGNPTVINWIFY